MKNSGPKTKCNTTEWQKNRILISYTIVVWRPLKGQMANSVDPDQTPQNAASDWSLQCLQVCLC